MADATKKLTHTAEQIDAAVGMLLEVYTREEIDALLAQKITSVPGSGLMTDEEKEKLSTLENYDDSEVKSQISLNRSTLGYQRKNLLKNTASSQLINGVTFTMNEDGGVTTNGTATASINFVLYEWTDFPQELSGRDLRLTGCPQGDSVSGYRIAMHRKLNTDAPYTGIGADVGNGVIVNTSAKYCRVLIGIGANTDVDGLTFYPMLRYAEITDDSYEPYKDDLQTQIDNITTEKPYTLAAVYTRDLTSGEDLSKVTAPGVYRSATAAITNSLANKPDDLSSGFKMIVEVIQGASHVLQTIKSQAGKTYIRHLNLTSGAADNWFSLVSSDELADLEARVAALEGGDT